MTDHQFTTRTFTPVPCSRAGAVTNNDSYLRASAAGVRWSLACQRNDGSWPYGERVDLMWVDGFHTGYVLEALQTCQRAGVDEDIAPAWERGIDYYDRVLFTSDDAPKYYSNSLYPIDASCVAQAIQTFAMASTIEPTRVRRSWATFGWALQHLRRRDGLFMFQRRRYWANRIPHMRWAQATMLLAMTHLLDAAAWVDASAEGSRST